MSSYRLIEAERTSFPGSSSCAGCSGYPGAATRIDLGVMEEMARESYEWPSIAASPRPHVGVRRREEAR